jgi:hypothetical protein
MRATMTIKVNVLYKAYLTIGYLIFNSSNSDIWAKEKAKIARIINISATLGEGFICQIISNEAINPSKEKHIPRNENELKFLLPCTRAEHNPSKLKTARLTVVVKILFSISPKSPRRKM